MKSQSAVPSSPFYPYLSTKIFVQVAISLLFCITLAPVPVFGNASSHVGNNTGSTDVAFLQISVAKVGTEDTSGLDSAATRPLLPVQSTANDVYDVNGIDFQGQELVTYAGGTANISIEKITNPSSTYTSGSLRISLWALSAPYYGGSVSGHIMASIRTNQVTGLADSLAPGQYFYNISLHLPYTDGSASQTSHVLFLEEYDPARCSTSDLYCIIAAVNLVPTTGNSPVCSPSASSSNLPASGGSVTLSANCTNSPVSYQWVNNNNVISTSASFTVNIQPNTGTSALQYNFTVTATNASGNSSPATTSVIVAPPGFSHVDFPPPDFSQPCVRNATTSCLLNGRFRVQANWQSALGGSGGPTSVMYFSGGRAETDNAAVLYFQSPNFFEIGATLYDGCLYGSSNTWVFISGLTDWSWAMTISDTLHGTYKQYSNSYHNVTQTTTDYSAFSCN